MRKSAQLSSLQKLHNTKKPDDHGPPIATDIKIPTWHKLFLMKHCTFKNRIKMTIFMNLSSMVGIFHLTWLPQNTNEKLCK